MERIRIAILLVFLSVSVLVLGMVPEATAKESPITKVALVLNGTLGDKSFFDSAARGVELAEADLPIKAKVIEAGYDPSKWEPALEDAAASDYNIVIVGTWQMVDYVQDIAPRYPSKKFIVFDAVVDYSSGNLSNVYCMTYKQNEGSYLAGLYAALVSTSGLPMSNDAKVIGVIGGQDIPVINDFIVGYRQGALAVDPKMKVLVQYVGNWSDAAKAKEIALAMITQGADVIFNVAAGAGVGIFEAVRERKCYAIGVDSDQAMLFKETAPEMTAHILTSMVKNIDKSIYRALQLYCKGKLAFGQAEALGILEGAVGLAKNQYYDQYTPGGIKAKVLKAEKDILSGNVVVDTVFK